MAISNVGKEQQHFKFVSSREIARSLSKVWFWERLNWVSKKNFFLSALLMLYIPKLCDGAHPIVSIRTYKSLLLLDLYFHCLQNQTNWPPWYSHCCGSMLGLIYSPDLSQLQPLLVVPPTVSCRQCGGGQYCSRQKDYKLWWKSINCDMFEHSGSGPEGSIILLTFAVMHWIELCVPRLKCVF